MEWRLSCTKPSSWFLYECIYTYIYICVCVYISWINEVGHHWFRLCVVTAKHRLVISWTLWNKLPIRIQCKQFNSRIYVKKMSAILCSGLNILSGGFETASFPSHLQVLKFHPNPLKSNHKSKKRPCFCHGDLYIDLLFSNWCWNKTMLLFSVNTQIILKIEAMRHACLGLWGIFLRLIRERNGHSEW